jgi:hypothetical protein
VNSHDSSDSLAKSVKEAALVRYRVAPVPAGANNSALQTERVASVVTS